MRRLLRLPVLLLLLGVLITHPAPAISAQENHPRFDRYVFEVIARPEWTGVELYCLLENPSCRRDPWWAEWNELQGEAPVQYRFVGPGLVTEERFIDAVWLLWQWPEGQFLLSEAAKPGVLIFALARDDRETSFAVYQSWRRVIVVNVDFAETSTWMLAGLLAHELKHAADDRAAVRVGAYQRSYADCIAAERVGFEVERRYLRWIWDRFGGFPSGLEVVSLLSQEDYELYRNLMYIAYARDLNAEAVDQYRQTCAAQHRAA